MFKKIFLGFMFFCLSLSISITNSNAFMEITDDQPLFMLGADTELEVLNEIIIPPKTKFVYFQGNGIKYDIKDIQDEFTYCYLEVMEPKERTRSLKQKNSKDKPTILIVTSTERKEKDGYLYVNLFVNKRSIKKITCGSATKYPTIRYFKHMMHGLFQVSLNNNNSDIDDL